MSAFSEFLLNALTGALESVGESKLIDLLQDLHDSNQADYRATIAGGHALTLRLLPLVKRSKSKIDDAILTALDQAIKISAESNGIDLGDLQFSVKEK